MALKGTIQDFGIADIFQLISQQRKTGILNLNDDVDDVRIHYREGYVVRAESSTRPKHMLLGSMLVAADLIDQGQLQQALKIQGRTLQRLGGVLQEMGLADGDTIAEFARLQMTETVYRLFLWDSGTYEFEQTEVQPPADGIEPISADHILMEGVRMIDEWPRIRERITSYSAVVQQAKPLPLVADDELGPPEHRLHEILGEAPLDIQTLISRARIGEFETCRALLTLLQGGYVKEIVTGKKALPTAKREGKLAQLGLGQVLARAAGYLVIAGLVLLMARAFDASWYGVPWRGAVRFQPTTAHRYVANARLTAIRRALEVYRLHNGRYPKTLQALIREEMLREHDLRFPFEHRYYYEVRGDGYELLPPVN